MAQLQFRSVHSLSRCKPFLPRFSGRYTLFWASILESLIVAIQTLQAARLACPWRQKEGEDVLGDAFDGFLSCLRWRY